MQNLIQAVMAVAEQMARRSRFVLPAATIAAAAALALPASRAYAYGSLIQRWAWVDTDNCARIGGTLPIQTFPNGCALDDSWDGTFFQKDPGGEAIKLELRDGNGLVAKVEWHPYGEQLWVYDTRSDGDTVYVDFYCDSDDPDDSGVFRATNPPTIKNFEIPEGVFCTFDVYDDNALTDLIAVAPWGVS
jgi:hypothetical protein